MIYFKRRILFAALTLLAAGCNENAVKEYPIHGIDVSHHQKGIQWDTVKAAGIQFVYLKATEGANYRDSAYQDNITAARRAGIIAGSYHFFTFCKPAAGQARNFIAAVKVEKGDLPPALDVETVGNCKSAIDNERLMKSIDTFSREIEKEYKVKPVIYTTNFFYRRHFSGSMSGYAVWIRNTLMKPGMKKNETWSLWQYKVGPLKGVGTHVDLDAFKEDTNEFASFRIQ